MGNPTEVATATPTRSVTNPHHRCPAAGAVRVPAEEVAFMEEFFDGLLDGHRGGTRTSKATR